MNRTYQIINISDLNNIDFSQVYETSAETIRKSIDESLFTIKWDREPSFITDGTVTPVETLSYENCLSLMATAEWTPEEPSEE